MKSFIVAKRLIKQISNDKRSIGLMFLAPVFVLFLLNVILTSSTSKPNIDIVNAPESIVSKLQDNANITKVGNADKALDNLKNNKSDAFIDYKGNKLTVTVEGADPSITGLVLNIINKVLGEETQDQVKNMVATLVRLNPAAAGNIKDLAPKPEIKFLHGSADMDMFDSMAPMMMGFFIFFFVFLIAGISFLRERISGTLDRILATPLKRSEIVYGYFLGFGLFVAMQTVVIQLFMIYGLNISLKGSFWVLLFINIILAAGSLSLGTLLSAFAANEFQLFQFIPIVIVPQILFSGLFDLRDAPQWVIILSKIFPMSYGASALRDVAIRGYGLEKVLPNIVILIAYAVLFLILNILVLKKYRKT